VTLERRLTILCPVAVANFSKKSGRAIFAKCGDADMHPRSATFKSSAVMPYGSLGGGRKAIGK